QVTTCGVPDGNGPLQIERKFLRELPHVVDARGDILKHPRPSSARLIDLPILDVPGRQALGGERGRQGIHDVQVGESFLITPAVNDDRDGERTRAFRHTQLAELKWIAAVREARDRRLRWKFED